MKKYTDEERPPGEYGACYDCGLHYSDPRFGDVSLPHDVWEAINPSQHKGCGLLCPCCILARLAEADLGGVEAKLYPAAKPQAAPPGDDVPS